jgi:REP element-mobilizing transposase RayT
MTQPRSTLIDISATPYYHCIGRCVRRAFLCGEDKYTGRNFDHRKQWMLDRLHFLSGIFAIDIAAYAIMSNHYHLVLHVDAAQSQSWSNEEVMERWLSIYKGPPLIQRFRRNDVLLAAELAVINDIIKTWRERLSSISWFMGLLNEYIAREANREDGCTGRFWEGRFKSQALLDETALLSCMAYVDLNPVRAGLANSLESSDFTSIQSRIRQVQAECVPSKKSSHNMPRLMPFIESEHVDRAFAAVPFNLKDYIDLVDWTGRCVRDDKRGAIMSHQPKVLDSMGLNHEQWLLLSLEIQKQSIALLSGMDQLVRLERRRLKPDFKAA